MSPFDYVLNFLTSVYFQIPLGTALFFFHAKRRKPFWILLPIFVAVYLLAYILPLVLTGSTFYTSSYLNIGFFQTTFLLLFLAFMLAFWALFDVPFLDILFYGTASYALQNIDFYFKVWLEYNCFSGQRNTVYFLVSLAFMVLLYLGFYFLFVRHYEKEKLAQRNNVLLYVFSFVILIVVLILCSYSQTTNESRLLSVQIYASLANLFLLIIQFRILDRSYIQYQKNISDKLLEEAKRQQLLFKENIDVINFKCHDLKHQINALRTIDSKEERQEAIEEIDKAIMVADSMAKTGNETLDVILTERSLQCENSKINFVYMLDGGLLSFLKAIDLTAFFGNLLSNAISASKKVEKESERYIFLSAKQQGDLVFVHEENRCLGQARFDKDGLPHTSHHNEMIHGFGTKSMKATCEKYGGSIRFHQEGDLFYVDAVFSPERK